MVVNPGTREKERVKEDYLHFCSQQILLFPFYKYSERLCGIIILGREVGQGEASLRVRQILLHKLHSRVKDRIKIASD